MPAGKTAPAGHPMQSPGFLRAVSRWEIVALSVNDVVGSGVYLLPAAAAALLGPASVGAVVVAGFAVLLLVLCFAEAASYFDRPGSAYLYARSAFGDFVGFEVGWMTWVARVTAVASLSAGFAQALGFLWQPANQGWGRDLVIALTLVGLTAINVVGVRSGVRAAVLLAIAKVLPLLLFITVGGIAALRSPLHPAGPPASVGWRQMAEAAMLLLFAYAGFENTAAPAGEFKNPRRDVPFALLAQIGIVTVLYSGVQWAALHTLPGLASSRTPLADAARLLLGSWGGWLLTAGGAVSILGTCSNTVLAGPRYLYALARDGFGPAWLARLHPRYRTPAVAILVQSAIALPLAFSGSFEGLAATSVVARLATYLGTAAAVPVLRRKLGRDAAALTLPGGPLIPGAAILLCALLAASATAENLIAGGAAAAVGALIFCVRRPAARGLEGD